MFILVKKNKENGTDLKLLEKSCLTGSNPGRGEGSRHPWRNDEWVTVTLESQSCHVSVVLIRDLVDRNSTVEKLRIVICSLAEVAIVLVHELGDVDPYLFKIIVCKLVGV